MIRIPVALDRTFALPADLASAFAFLSDIPVWSALFPRVAAIEPLPAHGALAWAWRMEPMGPPGYEAQTVYGCAYTIDPDAHTVSWEPIEAVGNARFAGSVALSEGRAETAATLQLSTELEIPAPRFARAIVQPAVAFEMGRMTDQFIGRLRDALAE